MGAKHDGGMQIVKLHNPFNLRYSQMPTSLEIALAIFEFVSKILLIFGFILLLVFFFQYVVLGIIIAVIMFSVIRILWYVFKGK